MRKATYYCEKCNKTKVVNIEDLENKKIELPQCCNSPMKRSYKNISIGDIVSNDMIHIGQQMLYS